MREKKPISRSLSARYHHLSPFTSLLLLFCCFSFFAPCAFCEEQITITTYYPAPYGIYREIRADQVAVGSSYRTTALSDGNLIVSGNVGIGATSPGAKLEIGSGDLLLKGNDPGDLIFRDATNNQKARIAMGSSVWSPSGAGSTLMFTTADNTADIAIDASGNVGIGTDTPTAKLDVNGRIRARQGTGVYQTATQCGGNLVLTNTCTYDPGACTMCWGTEDPRCYTRANNCDGTCPSLDEANFAALPATRTCTTPNTLVGRLADG